MVGLERMQIQEIDAAADNDDKTMTTGRCILPSVKDAKAEFNYILEKKKRV